MRQIKALTLIEMVAVLVIVSILAITAYPNYLKLQYETKRADAQSAVIATQSLVERYLAENNLANITSTIVTSDFTRYSTSASSGTAELSDDGYYRITIVPNSTGYAINATATVSGGLTDCTGSNAEYQQCIDTTCRVISIYNDTKQSTNSSGVTANEDATECW